MFDFAKKLGTISSNQTYTIPVATDGTPAYTNFLFEGTGAGIGSLTLTIYQGSGLVSNDVAQTSMWIDLHDVKDFYERAVITNITTGVISNWSSAVQIVEPILAPPLGGDTNLIIFIHGINVSQSAWLTAADTVFKRLYWAGYHGSFATVKWPCLRGV